MSTAGLILSAPTVEQHHSGFGIGTASPRLSWRFESSEDGPTNWEQSAYEIEVAGPSAQQTWKVDSSSSVLVPWPSEPLHSREEVRVRVRVYGNDDSEPSAWSPTTIVEVALLQREDWKASPITDERLAALPSSSSRPPLRFRRTFTAPAVGDIAGRARLYITSLGVYRAFINGKRVGDECMAPGWTSYEHRLHYQVFDVTDLLQPERPNVIAVEVAEGWYAGRLSFGGGKSCIYGSETGPIVQLEVGPANESSVLVASDDSWKCQPSAITQSEIYDGESYDARLDSSTWHASADESDGWAQVKVLPTPSAALVIADAPPVRVIEEVRPKEFITSPSGKTIIDFGQNLVGRILVRDIHVPSGTVVTFVHAEVLEHGELGTRPLRIAKCTDTLISSGEPIKNWSPQYTFHGFRYLLVEGWSTDEASGPPLSADTICAQVMHTDMTRTGHFECSNPKVNQLHSNATWSMKGNFFSIPSDCPQRDERLGWTGDIQVFTPSASFLYNTAGILGDWLKDLAAEQLAPGQDGIVPFVVPNVVQETWPLMPQAIWDDAAVLTPWDLYRSYGDIDILRRQYLSMVTFIDKSVQRAEDRLWDPELRQLGDWLDPAAPPTQPGNGRTNGLLVADAYLVHVTSVLAQISGILGEEADAERYGQDARQLKKLFREKYITPTGLVAGDSQTALSLAIVFDLFETPKQAATAGDRLAWHVRQSSFKVATGFAGTPIVTHALSKSGHHQTAHRMLREEACPSWLYPITMGATTIWERWDSMMPDGTINPGEMTSFNHYALGSVINWLHESVAGLRPLEPGWKRFMVAPLPGGKLTSACASYETPYGRAECSWSISGGNRFSLDVLIPANCKAVIVLPHENRNLGTTHASFLRRDYSGVGQVVGSGRHTFESEWDSAAQWPPKELVYPRPGNSAWKDLERRRAAR